jgi:hypothetical protein
MGKFEFKHELQFKFEFKLNLEIDFGQDLE